MASDQTQDQPYVLLSKIGEGGMAEVFKAMKRGPDDWQKPIALKRILPFLADDPSFIRMLSAEARLQAKLDHPNLVQTLDFFHHNQTYYLAMEYVPGRNLRQIHLDLQEKKRQLPWQLTVFTIAETLKGLQHAHQRKGTEGPLQIVHRDISPQNILVSFEGVVKLSDFGIAHANVERERTESGILKGKQRYLSPEQLEGKILTAQSDIFSMGSVLYESLSGIHPFDAESDFESMKRIAECKYRPLNEITEGLPKPLIRATHQALSKNLGERFETASDLRKAILETQESSYLTSGTDHLKDFMKEIYPKAEEFFEKKMEPTPLMPRAGTPIPETLPSDASSPIKKRTFPRKIGLFFLLTLALALFLLWNQNRIRPDPSMAKNPLETEAQAKKTTETSEIELSSSKNLSEKSTSTVSNLEAFKKDENERSDRRAPTKGEVQAGYLLIKEPRGFEIFVNGKRVGISPLRYPLKPRKDGYLIYGVRGKERSIAERIQIQSKGTTQHGLSFLKP